jgi:exodeoxyribonuclease-5
MSGDTLYLCATSRLAQTLREERPADALSWQTPQALTIAQWLTMLADEALLSGTADLPQALDGDAERLLWEQVIADALASGTSAAAALFDLPGLAASAMEAHALCRRWAIDAGGVSDEMRLFALWQVSFLKRCREAGWIDVGGLHLALLERLTEGLFTLPGRVLLCGFDRLTPLEQRLFDVLARRGVVIEQQDFSVLTSSSPVAHACTDATAECHAAVAWAVAQLAAAPGRRIGIVAPDLAGVRDRLAGLLDEALHPLAMRPDGAELPRSYNISLGRPLAAQPLVRGALELLALGSGRAVVEQSRLSALLLGAFWAGDVSEADARACLDAALRRELPYFTNAAALIRLAGRQPQSCARSVEALRAALSILAEAPRSQLPGAWGRCFRQALAAFGWPGERTLSSDEFQAHRAFGELLDGFGRFDALLGRIGQGAALARLRELCRQRLFQPETRGRPAIQVLGVLESAGLNFDALWVMGLNDDRWPAPPRPNPLLSVEAQRAAGSAHASADVELDFARRVHARLLRSAATVTLSWACADGNRMLRPSPLLGELVSAPMLDQRVLTLASRLLSDVACVAVDDALAPPVGAGEVVAGGSWLLRAQAICPAWAFHQFRLGAQALDAPVEGLDPAARGTLVHAALEHFWRRLGGSEGLAALGEDAGRRLLGEAVEAALAQFEEQHRSPLPQRFRQLEGARLVRLLERWLAVERARPQPFTVIACEQAASVEIEGIRVNMVVDRIDRLADGRQLIIDYKTGAAIDVHNWASPRITEPQLPIYAALIGDEVAAVVFAKVLIDKPAFAGIADADDLLPGVRGLADARQKIFPADRFPDWPSVIAHWRDSLQQVAREVRAGVAGVSFANEGDLKYCEVLPLLRLPERRRLLQGRRQQQP